LGRVKSLGYTHVFSEQGARIIFLQEGPKFEVTPLQRHLKTLMTSGRLEQSFRAYWSNKAFTQSIDSQVPTSNSMRLCNSEIPSLPRELTNIAALHGSWLSNK